MLIYHPFHILFALKKSFFFLKLTRAFFTKSQNRQIKTGISKEIFWEKLKMCPQYQSITSVVCPGVHSMQRPQESWKWPISSISRSISVSFSSFISLWKQLATCLSAMSARPWPDSCVPRENWLQPQRKKKPAVARGFSHYNVFLFNGAYTISAKINILKV